MMNLQVCNSRHRTVFYSSCPDCGESVGKDVGTEPVTANDFKETEYMKFSCVPEPPGCGELKTWKVSIPNDLTEIEFLDRFK